MTDLHALKPEHEAVHDMLCHWGLWSNPGSATSPIGPQPTWRLYRPYMVPREESKPSSVDKLTALRVQTIMHEVPEKQRHALGWAYVHPYIHPGKVCRMLGVNMAGLKRLLDDGRTMVKNLVTKKAAETA